LTPATIENMPVGQKITDYEQILTDQARFTEKLEELRKKGNAVLERAGIEFTIHVQNSDIKVPKKRKVDPTLSAFAHRIGNDVSSIIANGSTSETTLEKYLGGESYAKLKAIAEEYSIQGYGTKQVDENESDKVWQEYVKVRKDYQETRDEL